MTVYWSLDSLSGLNTSVEQIPHCTHCIISNGHLKTQKEINDSDVLGSSGGSEEPFAQAGSSSRSAFETPSCPLNSAESRVKLDCMCAGAGGPEPGPGRTAMAPKHDGYRCGMINWGYGKIAGRRYWKTGVKEEKMWRAGDTDEGGWLQT